MIWLLLEHEKLEPLGNGISVIVSYEHHFFLDTILLADFAHPKKAEIAVDLGSGCGTIPFLWSRENILKNIVAVEIQQNAVDMIHRSLKHNNLKEKVEVICADLKNLKGKLNFGVFDLVVCNPPYKPIGAGVVSKIDSHKVVRHESSCTVEDVVLAASQLLRFGGRFCLCLRPERLTDVLVAFRNNKIEPKRLRFVQQRKDKPPKLFLIEGKRGGNKGGLVMEPTLFIEDESGSCSQEMVRIYGTYKDVEKA